MLTLAVVANANLSLSGLWASWLSYETPILRPVALIQIVGLPLDLEAETALTGL